MCGYFKVLRSLFKPKSTYSSKGGHNSAPIMIRVQAPNKKFSNKNTINLFAKDKDEVKKVNKSNYGNKTIRNNNNRSSVLRIN